LDLKNLPEVNFASETLEELIDKNVSELEKIATEVLGEPTVIYPGHKWRVMVQMLSTIEHQILLNINERARGNLLRYSDKNITKHIGARTNTFIGESKKAKTTIRVILSKIFEIEYVIKAGSLFTPGDNIYFENIEDIIIQPGETSIDFDVYCTVPGTLGNDFLVGQINKAATSLPFIESISNTIKSYDGSDEEDLDNFKERIRLSPSTYNTAGADPAYVAMAKNYSVDVSDVYVYSSAPETVDVVFLMESGIPSVDDIAGMLAYISDKSRRPLNDKVNAVAPTSKDYALNYEYYISSSDSLAEEDIKLKVSAAEAEYQKWQSGAIGRNINPSKFHALLSAAGASRVVINSPVYTVVGTTEVANCTGTTSTYGGLEDDGS